MSTVTPTDSDGNSNEKYRGMTTTTVRLSGETLRRLDTIADDRSRSRSEILRRAAQQFVDDADADVDVDVDSNTDSAVTVEDLERRIAKLERAVDVDTNSETIISDSVNDDPDPDADADSEFIAPDPPSYVAVFTDNDTPPGLKDALLEAGYMPGRGVDERIDILTDVVEAINLIAMRSKSEIPTRRADFINQLFDDELRDIQEKTYWERRIRPAINQLIDVGYLARQNKGYMISG